MKAIVRQALIRAMDLHAGQLRKDGITPYIVHPIQAAMLLARAGCDDDTIAAGLLHDTVEDTPYTLKELRREFGSRIAEMVDACSEIKSIEGWDERKDELFGRLTMASREAKIVKTADALANMIDLVCALDRTNGAFWKKFHATPQQKLSYFRGVYDLTRRLLPKSIREEYEETLAMLTRIV